ncbi:DUF397 domain-containing protein [Actinomadura gamaensis]|uniref:DUF397 domain-containing protein n=1 Tax=Actinomadura gamaensis TaxID=1763541 RepID=A0ABV9U6U4_9ACTN
MTETRWRKASRSSDKGDDCVELRGLLDGVVVRDSKRPEAGHLLLSRDAFRVAVTRIRGD